MTLYRRKAVEAYQFRADSEDAQPGVGRYQDRTGGPFRFAMYGGAGLREVSDGDWIVGDQSIGYSVFRPIEFEALFEEADPADLLENASWLRGALFGVIDAAGGKVSIEANQFWKMPMGRVSYRYERTEIRDDSAWCKEYDWRTKTVCNLVLETQPGRVPVTPAPVGEPPVVTTSNEGTQAILETAGELDEEAPSLPFDPFDGLEFNEVGKFIESERPT